MNTLFYEDIKQSNLLTVDFTRHEARKNWRISNDNVMGGLSEGHIKLLSDKVVFMGNISLENNGGFSAVFHAVKPMKDISNFVCLDFIGDGNCYQMRLITNEHDKQTYYFHEFNTFKGMRQKITLNLADFQATFRGKKVIGAPKLVSQHIEEIGFLFTNKQAGPFVLSLFSLNFLA